MDMMAEPMQSLSVVPIFVNAGSALLPAIIAPVVSALALLVRPRELARAVRRRPGRTVVTLMLLGVGAWGVVWMMKTPAAANVPAAGAAGSKVNWTVVALKMIEREDGGPTTRPTTRSTTQVTYATARTLVFGFNYSRVGHDGSAGPLELKREWEFNPVEGAAFLSSPVVRDGRVYATSMQTGPTGEKVGVVYCVDAQTGQQIWKLEKLADRDIKPIFSSPAITEDGKLLLLGEGLHFDSDSRLLCIETETGKLKWQVQTPLHVESSPAIHGDLVVVGAGSIEDNDKKPRGHPGLVVAVRISDGKKWWEHQINDPESSPAFSADGSVVYIGSGFGGNAVVALRTESDEQLKARSLARELWRTPMKQPASGAITLIGDTVIACGGNSDYVQSDRNPAGVVAALDAKTGAKRWEKPMPDSVLGWVAAKDGILICPVRDGTVVALRQSDGEQVWKKPVSGKSPVVAGCALTGKHVYAVSNDGYLVILDAKTGEGLKPVQMVNSEALPGELGLCLSAPVIYGSRVYIGSETGGLRCYRGEKVAE